MEDGFKRIATSYNALKPRPWEVSPARELKIMEEGKSLFGGSLDRFYCCVGKNFKQLEELPIEFFNHEVIELPLDKAEEIIQFISSFGMPIFPTSENIEANRAFNEAMLVRWYVQKHDPKAELENTFKIRINEQTEESPNHSSSAYINPSLDYLVRLENGDDIIEGAIAKVEACLASSVFPGVILSCEIKLAILKERITFDFPEEEVPFILYPTSEEEIRETISYINYATKSIKALGQGEVSDLLSLASDLDATVESIDASIDLGDGFVNAAVSEISNKLGFHFKGKQHYGSLTGTSNNEQGFLTEAIGAQLYNAAIDQTHWRKCEKCETLFQYRRSSSKYGGHHSDSSYCCDACSTAYRQTRSRRREQARKAAEKGTPLSEVLEKFEPAFHAIMKEAYESVTSPK